MFSLPNLEIHIPSCRLLNSPKLNLYILVVFMLLDRIDVSKSSGSDKLPGRLLQSLVVEITPIIQFIFTQSLVLANYLLNGHKLMLHLF